MKTITCLVAATVAVALAIPAHAQVDCSDWNTEAFFEAAVVSDVTRCLQAGASTNVRDENGWTPLHEAARWGTAEAVTTLLGACRELAPSKQESTTYEPFLVCKLLILGCRLLIPDRLLEAGPDPNARSELGSTPLSLAGLGGSAGAVTALLEAGADPNVRDADGKLPFDYAGDNEQIKGTDAYCGSTTPGFNSSSSRDVSCLVRNRGRMSHAA